MTDALGIKPPSFYAAFGSKAALYRRALDRWTATGAIPLHEILREDRPVAESLAALLEEAARRYAGDSAAPGCLVLEGTRCNDAEARASARALSDAAETVIRDYIAQRHQAQADPLTDYVTTIMSGLSAKARAGHSLDQLLASARTAGAALTPALSP